jgi:hypothetical protein
LHYDAYIDKYNKAADELADYDRPLANAIGSVIEFHFNHFREASRLSGGARIGRIARKFSGCIYDNRRLFEQAESSPAAAGLLDSMVTDWETEKIVRWANCAPNNLVKEISEIEAYLGKDISEYDRVKMQVLLAEAYLAMGKHREAIDYAKQLRNVPEFESWAEPIIRSHREGRND